MYLINAHVIPTDQSTEFGKCIGAYVTLFINYMDIDGAFELAKYYITSDGWKIDELEEECFKLESNSDVEENQLEFYNEALSDGYSLIFNCYLNDDE